MAYGQNFDLTLVDHPLSPKSNGGGGNVNGGNNGNGGGQADTSYIKMNEDDSTSLYVPRGIQSSVGVGGGGGGGGKLPMSASYQQQPT